MATIPDIGYLSTITGGSTLVFHGTLRDVSLDGYERPAVDVTNMSSTGGYREFIPSDLRDPGGMTCELLLNVAAVAALKTIAESTRETWTLTLPSQGATAASFACSGFVTGWSLGVPLDDAMTASVTIKFQGVPTLTAGTS